MGEITIAWELGGGFGHVMETLPIARALGAAGHRVAFVSRDPGRAATLVGRHGFLNLPAPIVSPTVPDTTPVGGQRNFADLLSACGWSDAPALDRAITAWLDVFARTRPALVLADHAPTALLACHLAGIRSMPLGTGFTVPPARAPFPSFRAGRPIDPDVDTRILDVVNGVVERRGGARLDALGDLYGGPSLLRTIPALDPYGPRDGADYFGSVADPTEGETGQWREAPGRRVFAYLDGADRCFEVLAGALVASGLPTLLVARDIDRTRYPALHAASISLVTHPIRIDPALASADLVISHGGHGLLCAAVRVGRPVLAYPLTLEQEMITGRAAENGIARCSFHRTDAGRVLADLVDSIDDDDRRRAAARIAETIGNPRTAASLAQIVARCEALL